jgi:large subunit ribosomal protein L25
MSEIVLNAELRETTGKHVKYARAKGMIPGVYYTHGENNLNIEVPSPNLDTIVFTSEMRIIDLRLSDGSSRKCILKDVQFDPVTDQPIHFDLLGLHENEKLTIEVPVVITGGTARGVKDGGLLQLSIHKLRVSCFPKDIPEKVEVNVADLGINDFVHVKDLTIPNVTIIESPESAVLGVIPPTIVKEPAPGEVAPEQPAEPEVVGKGKKAEEGEEGAEEPAPAPAKSRAQNP